MTDALQKHWLVLGGASSGKSAFAEAQALATGRRPIYIATAQVYDDEMKEKVARHRDMRGQVWRSIEEPMNLAGVLKARMTEDVVLIDCATMWLTNLMLAGADEKAAETALIEALGMCPCPVIVVSNEVGFGIVPDNALARRFGVLQGRFNQRLAAEVGTVVLVTAGLPMVLKGRLP